MELTQGINFIQGFSITFGSILCIIGGLYLTRYYLMNRLVSLYVKLNTKPVRVKILYDKYIQLILSDESVILLKYNEDLIYEEKRITIDGKIYSLFPGFDYSDIVSDDDEERIKIQK